MKKIPIILFALCMVFTAQAQQERFYQIYQGWSCNIAFENDTAYCLIGLGQQNEQHIKYKIIRQSTDKTGNFLGIDNEYFIEPYYSTDVFNRPDVMVRNKQSSYLSGYVCTGGGNDMFIPLLLKYDETIKDTLFSRKYTEWFPDKPAIFLVIESKDDFLFTIGSTLENDKRIMFFNKIDTLGNLVFTKKFYATDPSLYEGISSPIQLLPTQDKGFIITFQEAGYHSSFCPLHQDVYFLKLDSLGNEQWRRGLGKYQTPMAFEKPDGTYRVIYCDPYVKNPINPGASPVNNENRTIWVADMNQIGQISNKHSLREDLDTSFTTSTHIIQDAFQDSLGNIYIVGSRAYYEYQTFLIKVNAEGRGQWVRHYKCFPEDSFIGNHGGIRETLPYGLTPTSDGGFIISGKFENDSNHISSTQYIKSVPLNVYPNPASNSINIDAPEGLYAIYDMQGQICLNAWHKKDEKIDVSELQTGIYNIRINANGKIYFGKFMKE